MTPGKIYILITFTFHINKLSDHLFLVSVEPVVLVPELGPGVLRYLLLNVPGVDTVTGVTL